LLLGLLCTETDGAAMTLWDAGATLSAARHKVREALPPAPAGKFSPPLPSTPRADRAIGRAVRLSHQHRAGAVSSEHLLWGVLDVEGTAGQVLRSLGVDVDRLRTALEMRESASTAAADADEPVPAAGAPLTCPSCGADLNGNLAYRTVEAVATTAATGEHGPRPAIAFTCNACGHVLGVTSA
jgi:ATP-dependent Clp protease ATP-binding subunit ClpA